MSVDSPVEQAAAMSAESVDTVAEQVIGTVGRIHLDRIGESEVRAMVAREWERYNGATVRHFVPVLVHRAVIEQLAHHPAVAPIVH
jgi:hypothetical protein